MAAISRHILFWAPRVLCLAFVIFLSGFALDAFSDVHNFWQTLIARMIHLVPTAIIPGFWLLRGDGSGSTRYYLLFSLWRTC